jgi:hypothetical protein
LASADLAVEAETGIVVFERNLDAGRLAFTEGFVLIFWLRVLPRKKGDFTLLLKY